MGTFLIFTLSESKYFERVPTLSVWGVSYSQHPLASPRSPLHVWALKTLASTSSHHRQPTAAAYGILFSWAFWPGGISLAFLQVPLCITIILYNLYLVFSRCFAAGSSSDYPVCPRYQNGSLIDISCIYFRKKKIWTRKRKILGFAQVR